MGFGRNLPPRASVKVGVPGCAFAGAVAMTFVSGNGAFETLERRQLLAVISHTGTLLVKGDVDLGDRITVNQKAGTIIVLTGEGKIIVTFPAAAVKRFSVETLCRDYHVRVQHEVK